MPEKVIQATHVGEIKIGESTIPCAVLEDGTRLLNGVGFMRAIGRRGMAVQNLYQLPPFLAAKNLLPFIDAELADYTKPVLFTVQGRGGKPNYGYRAELLPQVCNVILAAREAGVLTHHQEPIARQCEILVRALAQLGIVALVDEATGYQEDRSRKALEELLGKYISDRLLAWAKTFPDEFYRQLFRLKGWNYSQLSSKRPPIVGQITNDLIYRRLAPAVLKELQHKNPRTEAGHRKHKHFQWLTADVGNPDLRAHLHTVIAFMRAANSWRAFYSNLERAFPKFGDTLQMPFEDGDE
ncbi:P63C domain-containing protein [bacterium]|nr:P63C domain-containing protein [bacterium]